MFLLNANKENIYVSLTNICSAKWGNRSAKTEVRVI